MHSLARTIVESLRVLQAFELDVFDSFFCRARLLLPEYQFLIHQALEERVLRVLVELDADLGPEFIG